MIDTLRASMRIGVTIDARRIGECMIDGIRANQPDGYPPIEEWVYEYSFLQPERDSLVLIYYHPDFPVRPDGSYIPYVDLWFTEKGND